MEKLQVAADDKELTIQKKKKKKREYVKRCDVLEESNNQLNAALSLLGKEKLES